MHAWPAPSSRPSPVRGCRCACTTPRTGEVRPTSPGAEATIYVCGITPYDATHMGHAATYVAFDLVQRVWLDAGHDVHYVQNVTDVDDPLLARALETGDDWEALADRETQLFREDMTALSVLPPRHYIGAVESIPAVVDYIQKLQTAGAVYDVDGDLYFRVRSDERFGSVAEPARGDDARDLRRARRRPRPSRQGAPARLPALACASVPGEPSWDSPFGRGRPGWHIECSAIALDHLGVTDRRAGRRQRPRLPAPRDGCRRGAGRHRLVALRAALHARRHGPSRRREDEQVPRQPGVRLTAARTPARTRPRSGSPSSRTTTAATGTGPTPVCPRPRHGSPPGALPWRRPAARRPSRCSTLFAPAPRRRPRRTGRPRRRRPLGRGDPAALRCRRRRGRGRGRARPRRRGRAARRRALTAPVTAERVRPAVRRGSGRARG